MRILLAEAQALVREGLKRVALEVDVKCEFVEAADAATARSLLRGAQSLDAVLFDEGLFTLDELATLRRDRPRLLLLALVARNDAGTSAQLLGAGVDALVPRSAPIEILGATLRVALAGDVCVRGNSGLRTYRSHAEWIVPGSRRGTGPLNLTSRQYDVLALVAKNCANKVIAAELGIGLRTVKGHVSVILRALHADNRADAGRAARRWLTRAMPRHPPAAAALSEIAIR